MKKAVPGVTDVGTTHPEFLAEAVRPEELLTVSSGSNKPLEWKHTGEDAPTHTWLSSMKSRVRGTGCPYCSTPVKTALKGYNTLKTLNPSISEEYSSRNTLTADEILLNHSKKVWWECDDGHAWEATPHQRNTAKTGCPFCSGSRIISGSSQSLHSERPDLTNEWHKDNIGTPKDYSISAAYRAKWSCSTCNHEYFNNIYHRSQGQNCRRCACKKTSKQEAELQEYIRSIHPTSINNARGVVGRLELDVYIPELKIGIEFNGVYWHSEKYKEKSAHYDRHKKAEAEGVQLIQIWEDDWLYNRPVVELMLKRKTQKSNEPRIPTRKTEIRLLQYNTASKFLDRTHIQGKARGTYYGALVWEGIPVAVLVVKKATKEGIGAYYIERYSTSAIVPGGMAKLMKFFERKVQVTKWITYADLSVSTGDMYIKSGFTLEKTLKPDYAYLRTSSRKREHKFNYRKDRFKRDPYLLYSTDSTESQLAEMNKMLKVWDAGKLKFIKTVRPLE
jgi:hypothetical protein